MNGNKKYHIYDASSNVIAEANSKKEIMKYYIYSPEGLLLAMVTPSEVYFYHYDYRGNTIGISNENGELVNKYTYTPFGIANQSETIAQPFKFVGKFGVMTELTGLCYMRARYYDPEVGRFISEGPIGFAGGDVNLYVYVSNNPIMFIDPWGLCPRDSNALSDVLRGAEFGVRAAKIVAEDVAWAVANYIPLPPKIGFVTGRGLSGMAISRNFYELEELANQVSRDIMIIRDDVFPN